MTDVEAVWAHATREQSDEAVVIWMDTHNRILGERPADAVAAGRAVEVLGAWDAYMEGSFA